MITEKVVTAAYCNSGYDIFGIYGYALKITTFCSKKCQVSIYQNVKNVIARITMLNDKFQNGKNVKNVRFQKCQISKMSDFKNVKFQKCQKCQIYNFEKKMIQNICHITP